MGTRYNAPHGVRDQSKLKRMIATLMAGGELPPVLVYGDDAYSGSHRLAAWAELDIEPDTIEINDGQFAAIMDATGFAGGSITDYEDFLAQANNLYNLEAV